MILFLASAVAWPFIFAGFQPAFFSLGALGPPWLAVFVLIVAAIAWIPPIVGPVDRLLSRLSKSTEVRPVAYSFVAGVTCTAYLTLTAIGQRRQFFPCMHDEFSYLIQAHQFASGHLWMPAHPLADFFDSFQLLCTPVYASAYFPGTALLYVPGIWLHLPPYCTSLAISGCVAGLMFWITLRIVGGVPAWLAMLLLLSNSLYRQLSIMTLGQLPLLLFALLAVVLWMRWQATGGRKSATLIGVFLGLAAVTRPVDALCFAFPMTVAMLLHRRRWDILCATIGTLPFLGLQLTLNHGITGQWTQTPFRLYADRDYPGTAYGFHRFDPRARPVSSLLQKQQIYQTYLKQLPDHRPENVLKDLFPTRLRLTLAQQSPTPYPLLILLCPLAVIGLARQRKPVAAASIAMIAVLPLFLILYAPYFFFLPHYVMLVAPALVLSGLIGARVVENAAGTCRRTVTVGLTLFIAGSAVASLPQWTPEHPDDVFTAPLLAAVNHQIEKLGSQPALIFFAFDPKRNLDEEPVYNADVDWPDNAQVVRAHDLGNRNYELIQYFSSRQPRRNVYRFDEATLTLLAVRRDQKK